MPIHNGGVHADNTPATPTTTIIPVPTTSVQPSLYWIRIDPIGDKQEGEIFFVNSSTNLPAGREILVQIYQASWHPGSHTLGEWSGSTGTVKVIQGNSGVNTLSFIVNSSTFQSDQYYITEMAVTDNETQSTTGFALFNITPRKIL